MNNSGNSKKEAKENIQNEGSYFPCGQHSNWREYYAKEITHANRGLKSKYTKASSY
jgi:hypothetical protein